MRVLTVEELTAVTGGQVGNPDPRQLDTGTAEFVGYSSTGTPMYQLEGVEITGTRPVGSPMSAADAAGIGTALGSAVGAGSWYFGGALAATDLGTAVAVGAVTGAVAGIVAVAIVGGAIYYLLD